MQVARAVCRHSGASPEDAVQQAFVKALDKPSRERSSIEEDEKNFTRWMCELTKWEAMTLRNAHRRRAEREITADTKTAELGMVLPSAEAVDARKMLEHPFKTLETKDQELLHALYAEEKSTQELAREQGRPWQTVDSHHRRLRDLLYITLKATIAALLLAPKKARAFVGNVAQQAAPLASTMTVTAVCGVVFPTGSSQATESSLLLGLTQVDAHQVDVAEPARLQACMLAEVEPEEPKVFDAVTNTCSPADMKSTKFANIVQETVVPLAFVVAPALTQVACAGTAPQTQSVQPTDDDLEKQREKEAARAYEVACDQERARGNPCPSREEFSKIGRPR